MQFWSRLLCLGVKIFIDASWFSSMHLFFSTFDFELKSCSVVDHINYWLICNLILGITMVLNNCQSEKSCNHCCVVLRQTQWQLVGFQQPVFMPIFDLCIKHLSGNAENLKKILKCCLKAFLLEGGWKVGVWIKDKHKHCECNGNRFRE